MLRRLFSKIGRRINHWRASRFVEPADVQLIRLGTLYGGWHVPETLLREGNVAVCAGAGEDVSFDVELNRKGLTVYTLDPTPKACTHVEALLEKAPAGTAMPINNRPNDLYNFNEFDPSRFHFLHVGLWNRNEVMRFFAPTNPDHVSHSLLAEGKGEDYFEAECITLAELLLRINQRRISVLKLDIERAEFVVIDNMLESDLRPDCLLVEYDEGHSPIDSGYYGQIRASIRALRQAGYRLVNVEGWNFTFVRVP